MRDFNGNIVNPGGKVRFFGPGAGMYLEDMKRPDTFRAYGVIDSITVETRSPLIRTAPSSGLGSCMRAMEA